jgi:hypothetical protein
MVRTKKEISAGEGGILSNMVKKAESPVKK